MQVGPIFGGAGLGCRVTNLLLLVAHDHNSRAEDTDLAAAGGIGESQHVVVGMADAALHVLRLDGLAAVV